MGAGTIQIFVSNAATETITNQTTNTEPKMRRNKKVTEAIDKLCKKIMSVCKFIEFGEEHLRHQLENFSDFVGCQSLLEFRKEVNTGAKSTYEIERIEK